MRLRADRPPGRSLAPGQVPACSQTLSSAGQSFSCFLLSLTAGPGLRPHPPPLSVSTGSPVCSLVSHSAPQTPHVHDERLTPHPWLPAPTVPRGPPPTRLPCSCPDAAAMLSTGPGSPFSVGPLPRSPAPALTPSQQCRAQRVPEQCRMRPAKSCHSHWTRGRGVSAALMAGQPHCLGRRTPAPP